MSKNNRREWKKIGEELEQYLAFKRKGSKISPKKGKGSYSRKSKHKDREERLYA